MFLYFRVVEAVITRDPPRARATTRARRAQRARRAPASHIAGFQLTWRVLTRADGADVYFHVSPCTRRPGPSVNSETEDGCAEILEGLSAAARGAPTEGRGYGRGRDLLCVSFGHEERGAR